ncbi:MAG: tyrosine-type recombinase/integrase [Chloroflexi bacterium]|nr:tyrosine-type recombinase/integrase [Chloroflexota bacterium]
MADELHLEEFQAYLLAEDRSPVTIAGYVGDVRLFALWVEKQSKEPLTPGGLTNEAVRGYKQYLLDQANKPKTINRRLAALAAYAHWLEQAGYVKNARNPVQGVKAVRETALAPKWLDKKQRAALLRAVDKEVEDAVHRYPRLRLMYLRDAAIVKLILFAGLRVGEIIQLRMSDLFLDERKGSVVVREGKGTKRREIPLNARARKAILDYLRVRPEVESEYLFLGQRNEAIQSKTVQRAVGRFTETIDLQDVTPHTLRHTFAKSLIDSGVSLDKVATLLGHSNLNTTRIYTTPGVQDLEEAIGKLDNF